jgi:hypothetical protein
MGADPFWLVETPAPMTGWIPGWCTTLIQLKNSLTITHFDL